MKIKKIDEELLIFDNSTKITSLHYRDCSEHHWADFSMLESYNINPKTGKDINIYDIEFDNDVNNIIQLVEDIGFNLIALDGSKYLVPCYGLNNGYYNTSLKLKINTESSEFYIDIEKCQKVLDSNCTNI